MPKKTYTQEFKERLCGSLRPVASLLHPLPVNWTFPTPPFINGPRNWRCTELKSFQTVGIKRRRLEELRRLKRELEIVSKLTLKSTSYSLTLLLNFKTTNPNLALPEQKKRLLKAKFALALHI